MWKSRFKYYLTKNPLGFFLVLVNLGGIFSVFKLYSSNLDTSPVFIIVIVSLILDLPVILPLALVLSPIYFVFGIVVYAYIFATISILAIPFYWFYVGKKITNYFRKDDPDNNLSLTGSAD